MRAVAVFVVFFFPVFQSSISKRNFHSFPLAQLLFFQGCACKTGSEHLNEMDAQGDAGAQGGSQGPRPSNKRLQQTQAQVDEVVGIMKVNVEKVLERDQKLSQLDDRADALQEGASQFEKSAATLKRKYWWKNIKMMIIMCAIVVILIIIIVLWAGK
ncbi:CRE-SNB-1 protein [Caenorhabditis remanei]|uniref:Synaptobrevin-1 n=1 Tax=Caenorhabditis remanei TaxID=31234 RepID=E3LTF2_CAERE|nr:CRE-SNB-1 protein [Caenorhabditis remanei]